MKPLFSSIPFLIVWLLLATRVTGQSTLTVTSADNPSITPFELVQNYLIGQGITISDVTFNGSSDPITSKQTGYFVATGTAATELGMAEGTILSSGWVSQASGPGTFFASEQCGGTGDPDLTQLCNQATKDKSVIEFNFIPQSDIVTFRYVFGSEEFYQFCNSTYNDPFGFFLSGPGISGPFSNNSVDIALMPGSPNAVTINNVCDNQSSNWCNNPNLTTTWQDCAHATGQNITFNGITYVFTATYSVTPCETYHIKLAVADAFDEGYDSGVFLEKNSFSSNVISTNTIYFLNVGPYAVKACSDAVVEFQRPQPELTPVTINYTILGTAINGMDYSMISNSIVIPANQTSASLLIHPLPDAIPFEPDKTVILQISRMTCDGPVITETTVIIKDNNPFSADMQDITICDGSSALLAPVITGGQPIFPENNFIYLWSTGATTSSVSVTPPAGSHTYSVTITDACGQIATKTVIVNVGTTPGSAGDISGDPVICTPATGLVFSVLNVTGADSYTWSVPPGVTITQGTNTNAITVSISTSAVSGNVSVFAHSTYCGDGPPSILPLTIHPTPEPAGTIRGPESLCQGPTLQSYSIDLLQFSTSYDWVVPPGITITGGAGTNSISCLFTPSAISGYITVNGRNADCGTGQISRLFVNVNPLPGDAGIISSVNGSDVCQLQSGLTYQINPIANAAEYIWSYSGTGASLMPSGPLLTIDFSPTATSGILTVAGRNSCGDGAVSLPFSINVRTKPEVGFAVCNTLKTTKNGRPIRLRGGSPIGSAGVYSGTGVSQPQPGVYVFDPSDSGVTAGGTTTGNSYPVTYRYTNAEGCSDEQSVNVTVFASGSNDPCPGILKDYRDDSSYPTFLSGGGGTARCWMAANLNFGSVVNDKLVQSDNCLYEKYCPQNLETQCAATGGFYQWGEIMEYNETNLCQDLCPPGWHLPSAAEWNQLIDDFGGPGFAGGTLKDPLLPNSFSGLLSGIYYFNSQWAFSSGSVTGTMFWTSDALPGLRAGAHGLNYFNPSVSTYSPSHANALSVRCIRN